ncbi:DnaJ domain-containing protein [Butyrivibrio sp. AE3004]|uniref:DnaJ domain-containing protein n=1 Tax=Butyrivibrio sp. AE3004 TaxID=1506994 RepID=UPI000493BFD5|nr:DnaJ domain-containing protein [Butyrivibrio sp. AE3004]
MTLKEAYKILGASRSDADREIKKKYKKLLFLYHPDSAPGKERDFRDDNKIRQVIEAYRKIRESEGENYIEKYEFSWDAFENNNAFSERNIYVQFRIYDEALPISKMARGRFIWDPDMEEFALFSKSVLESCKEVMTYYQVVPDPERVKNIFHLMMQEYVLPADAARKVGNKVRDDGDKEVFQFTGFISDDGKGRAAAISTDTPVNIFLREDRAVAEEMVSGRILGKVSFDEDALYYVVLPLLDDPEIEMNAVITRMDKNKRGKMRIHVAIILAIPRGLTDKPVVNGNLIQGLLK